MRRWPALPNANSGISMGRKVSRSGSAGELDRGALPVLDDTVEELAEMGQVGGVNAGDGVASSCAPLA
jgi:hypothetical protein